MKHIAISLICITNLAFAQEKQNNDWTRLNLKGKVISTLEKEYQESQEGKVLHNPILLCSNKTFFNETGDILRSIYIKNKIITTHFENSYDKKNNKIQVKINEHSKNVIIDNFTYNDKNQLIGREFKIPIIGIFINHEYDSNGNEIKRERYVFSETNKKKELKNKEYFIYDVKGNNIQINYKDKDDLINFIEYFKYDENNNIIEQINSSIDRYEGDKPIFIDEPIKTYKYKAFDNQKNWITKTECIDGKVTSTTTREIKYY